MTEPRRCVECRRPLYRRAAETGLEFSYRIYCSLMCVEAWQRRRLEPRAED